MQDKLTFVSNTLLHDLFITSCEVWINTHLTSKICFAFSYSAILRILECTFSPLTSFFSHHLMDRGHLSICNIKDMDSNPSFSIYTNDNTHRSLANTWSCLAISPHCCEVFNQLDVYRSKNPILLSQTPQTTMMNTSRWMLSKLLIQS